MRAAYQPSSKARQAAKPPALYNALGHKLQVNDPNQGLTQYIYNGLGELKWQKDARDIVTTFNYDRLGRLTARYPQGEASSHWYFDGSKKGLPDRELLHGGDFIKTYGYDGLARVVKVTTNIKEGGQTHSYSQDFAFDSGYGRLTGARHPDGTAIYYQYTDAGYPQSESDSAGVLRTIEGMDHNGLLTKVGYRNELITQTARTTSGLVSSICTTHKDAECGATISDQVQYLQYDEYDSFGNLGRRQNHTQDISEVFLYDNMDRLISAEKKGIEGVYQYRDGNTTATTTYGYDDAGNMTAKSDFSLNTATAYLYGTADASARAASTDKAGPNAVKSVELAPWAYKDELPGADLTGYSMAYRYDKAGNILANLLTAPDGTSSTFRSLTYNANNKPVTITNHQGKTTTFAYGSDHLRYRQVADNKTTHYVGGGVFEATIDQQNNTERTRAYIGDYAVMNRCEGSGCQASEQVQLHWLHRDHLGSVDTVTGAYTLATLGTLSTLPLEQRSYDAFRQSPQQYWRHRHRRQAAIRHHQSRLHRPRTPRRIRPGPHERPSLRPGPLGGFFRPTRSSPCQIMGRA